MTQERKERFRIRMSEEEYEAFEVAVERLGCKTPELIRAISEGKYWMIPCPSEAQVLSLFQAYWALEESGKVAIAQSLLNLLEQWPELKRRYAEQFQLINKPTAHAAVDQIRELIAQKQPFEMAYTDASGNFNRFNILYAEISPADLKARHQYLQCWCTEENNDVLVELRYNRSFRLDRIQPESVVIPLLDETWKDGLSKVEVTMAISGGLRYAFEAYPGDKVERDGDRLIVKRQITSTFWFCRDIAVYGKDCIVLSPEPLRLQILKSLQAHLRLLED